MVNNSAQGLFNVNGLVAVITGGGSAKAAYITGRREQTLQAAAKTGVNGTIKSIVGDITDKESLSRGATLTSCFANAGVAGHMDVDMLEANDQHLGLEEFQKNLWQTSAEDHCNVMSVKLCNKEGNVNQASPIVITASSSGSHRNLISSFTYIKSWAAGIHLSKMLSTTLAQNNYGIRCNCLTPGLCPSELTQQWMKGEAKHGEFAGSHPLPRNFVPAGRTGSEQDYASLVLY
ncbi:hypothetical protein K470DRAFT_282847 [Piedraia hortae CBS 480.64]|uniref:NAD(P)-binding protein n=1 Tax=Piedraia hortae CBS 480.64 TaxID=1314780 RepID=A0A6A7BV63_9PEZI|nr:hypothetical protein K470DRAFT_282847 [Piedraia hortae CBS 480.64]